MRLIDPLLNTLIPRNYFGGAPKAPKPQKIPKPEPIHFPPPPPMPKFEQPKVSTAAEIAAAMPKPIPPEPIPPPPTTSTVEAAGAADEERRKQSQRRGAQQSIIAGEQDYASSATGTGSLLGG